MVFQTTRWAGTGTACTFPAEILFKQTFSRCTKNESKMRKDKTNRLVQLLSHLLLTVASYSLFLTKSDLACSRPQIHRLNQIHTRTHTHKCTHKQKAQNTTRFAQKTRMRHSAVSLEIAGPPPIAKIWTTTQVKKTFARFA